MREVRVGVIAALGLAGIVGFVLTAAGGPGFLARRQSIDIVFRDGQGIRTGSPVRVAGIDVGRVSEVDLVPVDGQLRARVRITVPKSLAGRLRQDLKVTIQASLTGQCVVSIVESGRSEQALVPGQVVRGTESTFFDPVLEQVGLGPAERTHLSHTIAEVRETVDVVGPRLRSVLVGLQETVAQLRETAETARPAIETTVGRVEALSSRLEAAKIDETLKGINDLVNHTEALVAENRGAIKSTLSTVEGLASDVRGVIAQDAPKVAQLLDGFDGTRARLDQVLNQANALATQGNSMLTVNRANIDRTVANVRDATDYGNKLVQKLYGNPFYLSPFYKPTREDIAAQDTYDTATAFSLGARELKDCLVTLEAMRAGKALPQMNKAEQDAYQKLFNQAWAILHQQLPQTNQRLAEGIRQATPSRR